MKQGLTLPEIYNISLESRKKAYLIRNDEGWGIGKKPSSASARRRVLSELYHALELLGSPRIAWNLVAEKESSDLPSIFANDGFLRMYAEAAACELSFFKRLWEKNLIIQENTLNPIHIGYTEDAHTYYDVDATPPGFLAKLFSKIRLKGEPQLLEMIQSDFNQLSHIEDFEKRQFLTLAILAHGLSYREVEGKILKIPSLTDPKPHVLVPYVFAQHLIWEGVKTISAFPIIHEEKERAVYICQGTEIWPSQPSMLGSIIANLAEEGSATEPYAHSWRRIHKHLKNLARPLLPFVVGHSMGGAMASQIALYSHPLIEKAFCFNPPAGGERDDAIYKNLEEDVQNKLWVFASIDDLPFWRIGNKVMGKVRCFLGEKRWKYRPLKRWQILLILPGLFNALHNMMTALPAHQRIVSLLKSYIYFDLTSEEIALENEERVKRFDHIDFFPKLYSPAKKLLRWARKFLGWELYDEYLKSQIEILELHEEELLSMLPENENLKDQIEDIRRQKELFTELLLKRRK